MTSVKTNPGTPWTLHLDRDGTEDFLIICDAEGNDLARSEFFWQPYTEDNVIPTVLAAGWLMFKAPKLLDALMALAQHADHDCPAHARSCFFIEALEQANAAIAEAISRPPYIGLPSAALLEEPLAASILLDGGRKTVADKQRMWHCSCSYPTRKRQNYGTAQAGTRRD